MFLILTALIPIYMFFTIVVGGTAGLTLLLLLALSRIHTGVILTLSIGFYSALLVLHIPRWSENSHDYPRYYYSLESSFPLHVLSAFIPLLLGAFVGALLRSRRNEESH